MTDDLFGLDKPPSAVGEVQTLELVESNPQASLAGRHLAMLSTPEGISDNLFREIIGATYTAYTVDKVVPNIDRIKALMNMTISKKKLSYVLDTEQFKQAILSRGVPWKNGDGLTGQQMYALQILTDPSVRGDVRTKLRKAGVTYQQYRAWLAQPQFANYLHQVSGNVLQDHIPDLKIALTKKAMEGDLNAIKFVFEMTGEHDPNKQQALELKAVMQTLIEIITRNVKDPAVLTAISNEFHLTLVANNVIKGELGS